MRLSRYNLTIRRSGSVLLTNLVTRAVVEVSETDYQDLSRLPHGLEGLPTDLRSHLAAGMFIVDEELDELEYVRHKVHEARYSSQELKLVVAPTMSCNYNCHYCFEEKAPTFLGPVEQRQILEHVARELPGKSALGIQWFGGEPLLAIEVVESLSRQLMALAESAGAGYSATLVTNGSRLTGPVSEALASLGVRSAQVTLDGDRHLHDKTRSDGEGSSYETLLGNVAEARVFMDVQIRVHVAPFSVDRVRNLLLDLAERGLADGETEIYFSPLFQYVPVPRLHGGASQFGADERRFFSAEQFAHAETGLYRQAAELGFRLPELLDASFGVCTAVQNNALVLGPRGNIYKCYFDLNNEARRVGSLSAGVAPGPRLLEWMDHEIARDAECESCTFLPVCFGGCTKKWHTGASKSTICTPFRYNWSDLVQLYEDHDALGE